MNVAIIGVGLIGGSLALCFKGKPGMKVVGYSKNPASVEKYLKRRVVDAATTSLAEAVQDADVIFLCVPVGNLEEYYEQLLAIPLKPGVIITDVGSTKQSIAAFAKQANLGINPVERSIHFIGGHPMAGKEKSGVDAATPTLFENAYYVLTPDTGTPEEVYNRLAELIKLTKAHIIRLEPQLHDDIVGAISHLPHIIAVALVNQVASHNAQNGLYELLAAGGFRDITRIASSDPIIWRDILLNNREVLLHLLAEWNERMAHFVQLLEQEDGAGIIEQFQAANAFRSQIPERGRGMMTAVYDMYVDVPDQPGIIGQIASVLGDHQVNLSNIQIMESRLDTPGILRLTFRDELDLQRAELLLQELDCTVNMG